MGGDVETKDRKKSITALAVFLQRKVCSEGGRHSEALVSLELKKNRGGEGGEQNLARRLRREPGELCTDCERESAIQKRGGNEQGIQRAEN